MALLRGINQKQKADENTGFGTNANSYGGRFINKKVQPI
jgi:inward rectifier potassium channel